MSTKQKFAHELLAATAKEMAATFYEELATQSDDFYKFYPKQKVFVSREWKRFIDIAKKTLSQMLGDPLTPEWQKEQIFEALVKHASLPGNIDKRVAHKMIEAGDIPDLPRQKMH